ncbi:MAG: nucleotidyltransferase family protein [Nitrosopumilus sp.]|nr:nucleotidyltransferase family protein [Nitrosopumilus sp.]
MKAIVNAGGKGTRAWPLSVFVPKSMMPIEGKPLLEHIVNYLNKFNEITEIIIIYDESKLGEQVPNFFDGKSYRTKLTFRKDKLRGTGGALLECAEDLKNEDDFILWFSDNLSNLDVQGMINQFRNSGCIGCIATRRKKPEETGFVKIDNSNKILQFIEKPISDLQQPEALGIYMFKTDIIKKIQERATDEEINLSFDIMQKLPSGSLLSYDIGNSVWIDIEGPTKIMRNTALIQNVLADTYDKNN